MFLLAGALTAFPGAASAAKAPADFFGTMADGPLLYNGFDDQREFDMMRSSGVETVRMAMPWSDLEPSPGEISFASTDVIVGQAASHGLVALPTVTFAPDWAARH